MNRIITGLIIILGLIIVIGVICDKTKKSKTTYSYVYTPPKPKGIPGIDYVDSTLMKNLEDSLTLWFKDNCLRKEGNRAILTGGIKAEVRIPRGETLDRLGRIVYQDFIPFERTYGVRCIKTLYDMCACYNGIKYSDSLKAGQIFYFYSPDLMGFDIIQPNTGDADSFSLYANVHRGNLTFKGGYIGKNIF